MCTVILCVGFYADAIRDTGIVGLKIRFRPAAVSFVLKAEIWLADRLKPLPAERKVRVDKYIVQGGNRLTGEVCISGAKNAAVAIIPAVLLNTKRSCAVTTEENGLSGRNSALFNVIS